MNNHIRHENREGAAQSSLAPETKMYKIGDLAREFDVTLRTLRFYEDRGLIMPMRSGTTRLYRDEDRERLRLALFCKRIGLSLGEISDILDLHRLEDRMAATSKIRDIYRSQMKVLQQRQVETDQTIAELHRAINDMDDRTAG